MGRYPSPDPSGQMVAIAGTFVPGQCVQLDMRREGAATSATLTHIQPAYVIREGTQAEYIAEDPARWVRQRAFIAQHRMRFYLVSVD